MHVAAATWMLLSLAGQVGGDYGSSGYGEASSDSFGPRVSVRSSQTKTRATTRATNPLGTTYAPERVATQPRYAGETPEYEQSLPPVGGSERAVREDPHSALANKLLRDMITPTRADQNVQSVRLYDALERTQNSQQQFSAIKAYWEWSLSVCELHGVLEEEAVLAQLAAPRTNHEAAAHSAQRKASRSRLEDSQLDVAAKVTDLLEATGLRSTSAIRPADVPFTGTYNTNFSKLFPNNSAPVTLKKIHQTLPYALKVVRSRGDSFETSRAAMFAARDAYQGSQGTYNEVVDAMSLVRSQRRAFLDSVHDYNFGIAEYALSIAGPGLGRETVVSMLIRTSGSTPYRGASLSPPSNILPVSATEDYGGDDEYSTFLVPTEMAGETVRATTHGVVLR